MKRLFLNKIACIALGTIILGCKKQSFNNESLSSPNVLLIVVDDLGYADMSFKSLVEDVSTPNIDALVQKGTHFTNAYATSSICSPSRAGLITGSYQQRWGTYWYGGKGIHDSTFKTIPEILRQKNYATGYVGKVHYGSNDQDITDRSFPLNHGFDYFYGHTSARKHYLNHSDSIEQKFLLDKKTFNKKGQSLRQQAFWKNTERKDTKGFSTEIFGEKAIQFVEKNKDSPFFLQVSFNAVHNFTHQLPQSYLDENNLKGYYDWNPITEEYYEWYKKGRYPNNYEGRGHYLGQLYYLDKEIGRIIESLKQNNVLDNTIVVFTSDNGGSTPIYANNLPLRGSKYTLYEGGIRVPVIISYNNVFNRGEEQTEMISTMDILPTLCDILSINSPDNIDGKSLLPLIEQQNKNHHEFLVWSNKSQVAVRKGKWKYRQANEQALINANYEMVELETGEFLYDLEMDIGETTNLINEYPEKALELKQIINQWTSEINN